MVQLIRLLGNKNIMKILAFFFRNPTKEFSQVKLLKNIKIAKATLIKWLKLLVNEKIVLMKKIGVTNLYRLNNGNTFVKYLKILFTISELEPVKQISKKYNLDIYIYGSCARGENVEKSDIDLLVIGKPDRSNLIKEMNDTAEKINKEIRIQIFSKQEWSLMARNDPPFYERVEKDKVEL